MKKSSLGKVVRNKNPIGVGCRFLLSHILLEDTSLYSFFVRLGAVQAGDEALR